MKRHIILILILLFTFDLSAQHSKVLIPPETKKLVSLSKKSSEYTAQLVGEITPISSDLKWKPIMVNKCIKHHSENDTLLEQVKIQKLNLKNSSLLGITESDNLAVLASASPVVGTNFLGNTNTGNSPLDNSMAISNGGIIVSVANNSIEFYDALGQMTFTNSIEGFFNDPTIKNVCDPVVIYDSGSDKFIFFAQECSGSSLNSNLLVCFSQTNNPNGRWWNYKLTGNPVANNTWFDYPKLAVSKNELYISGNSFSNNGVFKEALLYQIEKNNGFIGSTLNWQFWYNIEGAPSTLLPVSYGQQGNYGPGCYLVASKSSGGSIIDFYDLTDDMSASGEQLNHYSIPTLPYSPAADANQLGSSTKLDNGDCRALSGFYLDGIVHFVFHSDYSSGYNGINYNRLDVSTRKNSSSNFGISNYDCSYPSLASFATNVSDKSVMIGFGRSGSDIYPEIRVVNCANNMNWSSSTLVKSGISYSSYTATGIKPERWGDYTGICRKHNEVSATVWINGMFGAAAHNWETWIAEITGIAVQSSTQNIAKSESAKLYPNPVYNEFKTEFDIRNNDLITISILDVNGKLVKSLFEGLVNAGKNQFTFNKSNLESGIYYIKIMSSSRTIQNEKIVIAN